MTAGGCLEVATGPVASGAAVPCGACGDTFNPEAAHRAGLAKLAEVLRGTDTAAFGIGLFAITVTGSARVPGEDGT